MGLLRFLDQYPGIYHATCWLVFAAFLLYLLLPSLPRFRYVNWLRSEVIFALFLAFLLLVFRWPVLFYNGELNPDESFFIAGAQRLLAHPVFGQGLDGGTSGPLNFYILDLLPLVGLPISYGTIRFIGLSLVWGTLMLLYRTFLTVSDRAVARAAVLPLVTFFAFTSFWDFVHYSSEHAPIFGFSLALFLSVKALKATPPSRMRWLIAAGTAIALLPLTKPQSTLLAGSLLIILATALAWRTRGEITLCKTDFLALGAGLLIVPIALGLSLGAAGALGDFYDSYIWANAVYSGQKHEVSLAQMLYHLIDFGSQAPGFTAFALGSLFFVMFGCGLATLSERFRFALVGASILNVTAVITVAWPGRPSPHYLLFFAPTLGIWTAAALIAAWEATGGTPWTRRAWIITVLALTCLVPQIFSRAMTPNLLVGALTGSQRQDPGPVSRLNPERHRLAASKVLASIVKKNDAVTAWGFMPRLVVESGARLGTRDIVTDWQIIETDKREQFRHRFLRDLEQDQSVIFVDTVAEGSVRYSSRVTHGYETFLELKDYVERHYTLYAEVGGMRIFVRNDRVSELPPWVAP